MFCPPVDPCGCYETCPACHGAKGRMQRVRKCPIIYGSCCCTGCWSFEWVACCRCAGLGYIMRHRPHKYPVRPWNEPWRIPPPCPPRLAMRGDGREDARLARA